MDIGATQTQTNNSVLDQFRREEEEKPKNNELGKDAFLKLLVTQMENQNPLEPQDNGDFIAQMAQFSSLEGIDNLNSTLGDFVGSFQSSSALEATALVGRKVLVDSDKAWLQEGNMMLGMVDLPVSSPNVQLSIYDKAGQLVRNVNMGSQPAGEHDLVWDGANNSGDALPSGLYTVKAQARIDGEMQQLATYLGANVNSVTLGTNGGGTVLNLAGIGKMPVEDVKTVL